ncbi:MAG: hypothetical protein ACRYF9_26530 [Janthinobacterium lividum]
MAKSRLSRAIVANDAAQGRTDGVKKVLKDSPGIKIVEQQTAEWQRSKAWT